MKKHLFIKLSLLLLLVIWNTHAWGTNYVRFYCKMTYDWWKNDGAAIGAHYWNSSNNSITTSWPGVRMNKMADDMWYIDIDTDTYDRVIFTRVNGSGDIIDWGAKTGDQSLPSDNNFFTITSSSAVWGDPGCTGSWSVYVPSELKIDGPLPGNWDNCQAMSNSSSTFTYTVYNKAAGSYEFCFKNNSCVAEALLKPGNGVSLTGVNCTLGTSGDSNNNFKVTTSTAGNVTITVTYSGQSISVTATAPAPTYTVSYNGNGGTGSTSSHTGVTYNTSITTRANGFTRTGWEFDGWNTDQYGEGTSYAAGASMTVTGNVTLYAKWKKVVYLKSNKSWWYNDNAWFAVWCANADESKQAWVEMSKADNCSDPVVYKATIPGNGYTKLEFVRKDPSDKTLATWDNKWNGTSKESLPTTNNQFTITEDACTGSWGTYSAPTFTISYAKGSPSASISGSKGNESKSCDVAFTLPNSAVFTRTGYTQTGWTTTDGGSKTHNLGGSYTTNADQTFYPVWTATTYSITYHLNEGTQQVSPTPATSYTIESSAITLPTPTRDGYIFDGWFDNSSFTGSAITTIAAGSTGDKEYWAKWTEAAETYTITYGVGTSYTSMGGLTAYDNTASAAVGASPASVEASHNITFTAAPNPGHEVVAWYINAACNAGEHSVGATTYTIASLTADQNVYVKFLLSTYSITYNNMEGATNHVSNPATYQYTTPTITLETPTKTGYNFGGWFTDDGVWNNQVTSIPLGSTGNKVLYAKWTAKQTTVTLNKQSGSGGSNSVTATYDSAMPAADMPTRTGYDFGGYYTETGGDGTPYYTSGGASARNWDITDATKTLYAKWTVHNYTITYHLDEGTNHGSNPATYTIESSAITLQNPTKYGYDFDGWYTNEGKTIEGHTIAAGSHENKEFWAKWTAKANVTIKFKNTDNWSEVHAHAWDATGNLNGGWPGNTINQIDGWYTYSLKWGANIIFNNGSGAQSHNITSIGEDACYVWDNGDVGIDNNCDGVPDYDTRTIFVHVPNDWSDSYLNIYTWGADYYNSPGWPGSSHGTGGNKTEYIGGRWFKVTINNICGSFKLNNGDDHQTSDLTTNDYADGTCWNASGGSNLTTTSCPDIPTVTNASGASNIRDTQAQLNGTASSDPLTVTEYGFYYSSSETTKAGLLENGTKVTGTGSASSFSYTATGLSNATTYYYIAYAVNGKGTAYADSPSSFTTKYQLNYGIGDVKGGDGSISSSPATSSGSYVANGTVITLTAPDEKTGYTWKGWYGATGGTGDQLCATKAYAITISGNTSVYACYTINNHAIMHSDASHGSYTIQVGSAAAVSTSTTSDYGKTITLAATPATGYHFGSWSAYRTGTPATTITVTSNQFTMPDYAVTVGATFSPTTYSITYHTNGGSEIPAGSYNIETATFALPTTSTKTGYTFAGWYTNSELTGDAVSSITVGSYSNKEYWAKWTPKPYTVVLDKQTSAEGYGSEGTVANQTVTFDATPATVSGTMPSAANGYAFMGFYSATGGNGRCFIDPSGEWVANAGDTISGGNWVKPAGITLYAYYKKAQITGITFTDGAVVTPNTSKTVTATISPTPTGTTTVCWRVLYSNDNPLDPQPEFSSVSGNSVSFTAPEASGMYKIEAVLHTGSGCGGAELSTYVANFQVAGDHTVTVQYKDASGNVIAASGSVTGKPLEWSEEAITAPDIFGYTFARWEAGDGVTISTDRTNPIVGTSTTTRNIYIQAVYDGRLTAVYNKKQMIYFKNTLGWGGVYVNFMTQSYWNAYNGSGNSNNYHSRNNQMSLVPGTTNIYYFEYTGTSTAYVSFTSKSQSDAANFWESDANGNVAVCYPTKYDDGGSENSYYGLNWGTPMFVPLSDQTPIKKNDTNTGGAYYYNKGYWRYYDPVRGEEAGTGYTLKIYNKTDADGRVELSSTAFTNANVDGQLFKATVNLEAAGGYGVKILRNNSMLYTNIDGHLQRTGDVVVTERENDNYKAIWIKATAAGDYDFIITCNGDGKLCIQATFPAAVGDYRVLYTDNATWSNSAHTAQTWYHPSRVISAEGNAEDTISFYVAKDNSPQYKIEKVDVINETTGAISWTQVQAWTDISVAKTGVYNFKITQNAAGDGISSVVNMGEYTGNYYIRTDCAGSTKWDNYKTADHMMTYSEYSKEHSDYTHYYMKFVESGTNVKFTVANDYSPCVSDTIVTHSYRGGDASHVYDSDGVGYKKGDIKADANIRFMWDMRNNKLIRAYLARGKNDGSNFLVLRANSNTDMLDKDGNALLNSANSGEAGYNHKAPDNCMQFVDNENWIYEANIKIKPGAFVKLYAYFNSAYFYFKGEDNNTFDEDNAIKLMDGSGDAELVRVIYDFKTDRLVAAWQPSGNISSEREINADVMFVREHQGDIEQLTFTESGAITEIKTAYAVLRFNKWTINNKSKEVGHSPLSPLLSRYERDLFYVSFPFRVAMNEVFGFGTYGKHWIIEYYDGAARAANGFWADTPSYWRFVTDRKDKYFEPNQGYIIALDLDELGESSSIWDNGVENVELYFPSYGTMGDITNASVEHTLPSHECTINRPTPDGNRTIKDSHWNVMSVPTYVNTSNVSFTNTDWTATRPSFLYEWNMDDNSLTPRSGSGYTYHAMHAYIVQYAGDVTWTSTSVTPASIVARRSYSEKPSEVEFRLELSQDDQIADQTYVRLSDDEEVSAGFAFGEDMSKEFNKTRSNIYTFVGTEQVAGNVLPMTEQTTVVPVGVKITADGDYTFAIPEGTNGTGVTLIDTYTGVSTPLGLTSYTVDLEAGTYNERFVLEISPVKQTPTDIENSAVSSHNSDVRKVLIDNMLYIVKDGEVFDARGARVQ